MSQASSGVTKSKSSGPVQNPNGQTSVMPGQQGTFNGEAGFLPDGTYVQWDSSTNSWMPGRDWRAKNVSGGGQTSGEDHHESSLPSEGDTKVDSYGRQYIYHNGSWIDFAVYYNDPEAGKRDNGGHSNYPWDNYGPPFVPPKPTPPPPVRPPRDAVAPEEDIRRNPEEIDMNEDAPLTNVDVNPVGGVVGYNYLGPYTTVSRNVAAGVPPVDELDGLAMEHDIAYQSIADRYHRGELSYGDVRDLVYAADRKLKHGAWRLWWSMPAQYTALGMDVKAFVDSLRGYASFVGITKPLSPVGYRSFGVGSPAPFFRRAIARVRSVDNAYVRGFRIPRGYDDDRDRNFMPDVMQAYLPLRRRRYYNW